MLEKYDEMFSCPGEFDGMFDCDYLHYLPSNAVFQFIANS
jgi:hypothetical protein